MPPTSPVPGPQDIKPVKPQAQQVHGPAVAPSSPAPLDLSKAPVGLLPVTAAALDLSQMSTPATAPASVVPPLDLSKVQPVLPVRPAPPTVNSAPVVVEPVAVAPQPVPAPPPPPTLRTVKEAMAEPESTTVEAAVGRGTVLNSPKPLLAVLALSIVGCIALGYLNWHNGQSASATQSELHSEIISLHAQLDDALSAVRSSSTPSPTSTPAGQTNVSASKALPLNEFAVSFVPESGITDLQYKAITGGGVTSLGFTSASMVGKYPTCTAGIALGYLSRQAKGGQAQVGQTLVATIGGYDYFYASPQTACSSNAGASDMQTSLSAKLATDLKALAAQ